MRINCKILPNKKENVRNKVRKKIFDVCSCVWLLVFWSYGDRICLPATYNRFDLISLDRQRLETKLLLAHKVLNAIGSGKFDVVSNCAFLGPAGDIVFLSRDSRITLFMVIL